MPSQPVSSGNMGSLKQIFLEHRIFELPLGSEPIFLGRGCDETPFSEEKGFSVKKGEAIQGIRGLVRISTGKAIQ